MNSARHAPGFSLIELLVVMALVASMAGGVGLALRDGNPARALESAQATVAGLLEGARAQAALHQNRAMLVVDADPADERFLRGVQVAVETAPNSGRWQIADSGAVLNRGIYFVPGVTGVEGATFPPAEENPGAWPDTRRSTLELLPDGAVSTVGGNAAGKYLGMSVPLSAAGIAVADGGEKLVLAAGRRSPGGVSFQHPDQVRGVALSSYGMALLINDASGFDF